MSMRSLLTLTVLICVSEFLVHSLVDPTQHCSGPVKTTRVSVDAKRNQTGHWITKVGWTDEGDLSLSHANKTDPWLVGVEHITTTCAGNAVQHTLTIITAPEGEGAKSIPAGYEFFPGEGYYKFHDSVATWPRARQVCTQEGAHLVIINSENEANVIKQLSTQFPNIPGPVTYKDYAWVGLYEQGINGQYFTIFGAPLNTTGFVRWTGTLAAGTDECVLVTRSNGALTDGFCYLTAPFVCELE